VKCSEFLNELTNYLDGELDAQTKTELDEHLAWCHNCYRLRYHRKTIEIYRDSNSTNCRRSAYPSAIGHHDQMCGAQETGSADPLGGRSHGFAVSVFLSTLLLHSSKCLSELSPEHLARTPAREPFLLYWNLNK